jgi:hypothetical protein
MRGPARDTRGSTHRRAETLSEWREGQLFAAGFDRSLARSLAAQPGVDLHKLLALVDAGCPPHLAARILAPL